jgi:Tol biopolymer transport system component
MYGGAGVDDSFATNTLSWSPDGNWVTVPVCAQVDADVSNECDSDQAFAYRTDGSDAYEFADPSNQVTQVGPHPGGAVMPQFCGSSTQILFRAANDTDTSYLIDRDGTNQQEIYLWPNEDPGLAECVPPTTGGGPAATVNIAQPLPFPRGTVVIPNTTSDSRIPIPQCNGFLAEAATYAFTSCLQCHASINVMGAYDVAADRSIVCLDTTKTETDEGPVWLGRPGKAPVELDSSLEDTDPAISPDGSRVAFVRYDPTTQSSDLYVINADGSGLKLLASGVGVPRVAFPAFSPDGSTIAYLAGNEGVKLVAVDGSQSRLIVIGRENGPLSWSPDAKWLAMVTNGQVYTYRTDGSDLYDQLDAKRQITHETDQWGLSNPQFNDDGSQILYLRSLDDSGDSGNYPYAIDSDGTNRQQVFLSPDPCMPYTCDGALNWGIFVPLATGGAVPRAVKPSQATVPNVHAFSRRAATRRLAKVRLTGKVTQRRFSSRVARGHVLSQYPRARAQASLKNKRGRTVKLVLSRGRRPAKKRR